MKKYSILQYIIGNYEHVHEVVEKDPDAEYIMVTDNKNINSNSWHIIYDESLNSLNTWGKCYSIRYNPFKYVNTDFLVYADASVIIKKPLTPLINEIENGNYDFGFMVHPDRFNLVDELNVWVQTRGYSIAQMKKEIAQMQMLNYDFSYKGMFECSFQIRRKNKTEMFDKILLDLIKFNPGFNDFDRLDQVLFSAIANKYLNKDKILPISEQIMSSQFMTWCHHNSDIPCRVNIWSKDKDDIKWFFNEPTSCKQFYV